MMVVYMVQLFCTVHLLLSTYITKSQEIIQSITLTPTYPGSPMDGARLFHNIAEVNTVNDIWSVDVLSQSSWQFIITLDNTYGFDASIPSAITITMNTPSINTDELLFGFTTDNENYVSMSIPMDNLGRSNQIYPSCTRGMASTQPFAPGDIAAIPNFDRSCDIAGYSCSNWHDMIPPNRAFDAAMSITFILEHNPATDTLSIYFGSTQRCEFSGGYQTESGLKIYIGGNNLGDTYMVSSFQLTSTAQNPTTSPTTQPSNQPTISPTDNPTLNPTTPTLNPTINPTLQPTVDPTKSTTHPTNVPTIPPSVRPTGPPTNVPTVSPSTFSPTSLPTEVSVSPTTVNPTVSPTKIPTIIPTAFPTYNPSISPSISPSMYPTTPEPTPPPVPPGFVLGAYDQFCPMSVTNTGLCRDTMDFVSGGSVLCLQPFDCCMCDLIACGYGGVPCTALSVGASGAYGVKDIRVAGAVTGTGASIDCQGTESCKESAIVANNVHLIDCDGNRACQNTTITVSEPKSGFILECSGIESCNGLQIEINFHEPPPGETCVPKIFSIPKISCNNKFACDGAQITINNKGCDKVLIENLECIQPNACDDAVFDLIGDVEISNCQCGPSCSNTIGISQCFENLERVLCPDPFSCAVQSKTITNPKPGFEFICSDVQSCEGADFVIELTPDAIQPIATLSKILFGGLYSARDATFTIDNQQDIALSVQLVECGGAGSCVDTTFIIGTNVFVETIICATDACSGCRIKQTATGPAIPCDVSSVRPLSWKVNFV